MGKGTRTKALVPHTHEEPPAPSTDSQVEVQDIINDLGAEIGSIRGQAIVDKRIYMANEQQWKIEKRALEEQIARLVERLSVLESQIVEGDDDKPE